MSRETCEDFPREEKPHQEEDGPLQKLALVTELIVQHSINRADSSSKSHIFGTVLYSIVRLFEILPPLGDTTSESQ